MEKALIDHLRHEVEKTYGRRILSSADCQHICVDIQQKTKLRISFNTLRRFFNLMKDLHLASHYTCEVLSQYCGFSSFAEFQKFRQDQAAETTEADSSVLDFLVHLFKNTEAAGSNDITYFSLVKQTICYLNRHPEMVDPFQREISKINNGRNYYFEQFVNIDKLNDYYGSGLRYYLSEKKTAEAQIIGQSLFCFRSWMTSDYGEIKKYITSLNEAYAHAAAAPHAMARMFASQLYHHEMMGMDTESLLIKARLYYSQLAPTRYTYSSYYCFEIILSEALLLTGQYEDALFYLEQILEKIKVYIPSYMDVALLETIALFKGICLVHSGKRAKAKEVFESINPGKFYFLSKKYLTILYLSLSKTIRHKSAEAEQVQQLVQDTGFTRLKVFWENCEALKYSFS